MKVYEAKTLIDSMEARSKQYNELREKLEQLKRTCNDVVNLDDRFKGKGADAIKGFYQAQIDVIEAWLRLIDRNIAFFNGIAGNTEDMDLSGNTIVHVPFLDDELTHHERNNGEMVSSQQDELQRIFHRIDDLVPLNVFSKDRFDDHMEKAEKDRKDTADAVDKLDNELKSEYILSEGDEQYVVTLFQQLMEASRQGNTITPIQFNAEAYKASDVYKLKDQAEQQTKEYLSFKDEQEKFREQLKKQEELENRPWYEKTWDGIKTFTGELTGYYDYIRASEGVDPVTGETLTAGQRVASGAMAAAGFIPVVGWAGRIAKGGNAIYKTAKGMNAADQALDVYRTTKTFSNLEKAEMGIYGLVSANGFSEYLTGKDMFGNALTEEQQQNSLNHALGLLAIGGMAFAPQLVKNGKMIREETINKAHEIATKTKAGAHSFIEGVKGGMRSALNPNNNNFAFAGTVSDVPMNVMDTSSVEKVFDGILAKFSVRSVGKGTVKDRQIDYTRGFDVEPKYSSYEQRVKTTPVNKGEWSSERAESLFISDKTGEVKKYLDEAGVDGVEYKNGMPDFSPFSKGEIKLENMTNDRKSNFSTADEELAKKWSTPDKKWTAEDVADWREDNKYTWHELNDLETIQLVPSKINSVFKHLGGVGEYNIKVKLGE